MKKRVLLAALGIVLLLGMGGLLLYNGVFWLNNPSKASYPVRGVDISAYQGTIDWPTLRAQDLDFAFIKASEGSSHRDPFFLTNWSEARKAGLRAGAYHFFSFESSGTTQAENFLAALSEAEAQSDEDWPAVLPPVVDIELYGEFQKNPPPAETVRRNLNLLLQALEEHCGVRPILYATQRAQEEYLSEEYAQYDLWIRSVYLAPQTDDWTFWQYSHKGKLSGYSGPERFIDLNVFSGSQEAFAAYGLPE